MVAKDKFEELLYFQFHVGGYLAFEADCVASNSFVEPDYQNDLEDEEDEGGSSKRRRWCSLPLRHERTIGDKHLPRFDATLKMRQGVTYPNA
ncbi:hypothetical protein QYM36_001653 [Artemia franciscana]|uniref:Uncharacterized protein n=1 Tax=Artemia franciscana TaxID=6661 RepID=A0AA88I6X1_ARTSF|nr:hypothetical protein QYM36_001653 [Artemia franciscana]